MRVGTQKKATKHVAKELYESAVRRRRRLFFCAAYLIAGSVCFSLPLVDPSIEEFFKGALGPAPATLVYVFWVACFCELVDATLGMGFGTTLAPLLLLAGYDPSVVVYSILMSELASSLAAVYMHQRDGNIDFRSDRRARSAATTLLILSLVGATVAVFAATRIPAEWTTLIIGIIVLLAGLVTLWVRHLNLPYSRARLLILGGIAAFNKGISGGGYGPIVSSGQVIAGLPVKNAVAITSLGELSTCFVALVGYAYAGFEPPYWMIIPMMTGALAAVPLATLLVRRVSDRILRSLVGAFTCFFGSLLLVKALNGLFF